MRGAGLRGSGLELDHDHDHGAEKVEDDEQLEHDKLQHVHHLDDDHHDRACEKGQSRRLRGTARLRGELQVHDPALTRSGVVLSPGRGEDVPSRRHGAV